MIEKNYGGAANAADWVDLSQFIDYDGYPPCSRRRRPPHGPAVVDEPSVLAVVVGRPTTITSMSAPVTSAVRKGRSRCISNGILSPTRWRW